MYGTMDGVCSYDIFSAIPRFLCAYYASEFAKPNVTMSHTPDLADA